MTGPQTMAEKMLARAAGRPRVTPGEIIDARVDVAMSHDNVALVQKQFRQIGIPKVWDPDRIVVIYDHRAPADTELTARNHAEGRAFVKEQGVRHFYDMKAGICHQVMPEKGHVWPGQVILGTDSHSTLYGAFGAFGLGVGATEMAGIWATGSLWLKVPESVHITVRGAFPAWVTAKDLSLRIIGDLGIDGCDYRSAEFHGPTIRSMSMAGRMVLANQAMEMGAKVGMIAPDETTWAYVRPRAIPPPDADAIARCAIPDEGARYVEHLAYDVDTLEPQVACPHSVDNVKPLSEVAGTEFHQAFIGSCTNGRMEDLAAAAEVLRGRVLAPHIRLIITPASMEVYRDALQAGYVTTLLDSGAVVTNAGCGACLGGHMGILAKGEVCLSSSNRNFQGRMGSRDSAVYLASPAVVAASCVTGAFTHPAELPPPSAGPPRVRARVGAGLVVIQ